MNKIAWRKPGGGLFFSRPDEYHRKLYESKGYTLITMPDSDTSGSPIVTTTMERKDITPRLADALIGVMENKDFWQGTATALLYLIGTSRGDIPRVANRLSSQIVQPYIADVLRDHGIVVDRRRNGKERTIVLSRRAR